MIVVNLISQYKAQRRNLAGSVGFVPTMGYLHQGHLALVAQARKENDFVVVSIFVNPTQFGPREDLARYPRDLPQDLALLEQERTDIVFVPSAEEMYAPGFSSWVDVERITQGLEGASRPGHFRGVATVVAKLFNIVEPSRAYFGQKDAQQVVVIQRIARDLNMNLEVVVAPTVREADGLAMSSRNIFLSPRERQAALVLYRSLCQAEELYVAGERDGDRVKQAMTQLIQQEPLAHIDYVSIASPESLEEMSHLQPPALVSLAVRIGVTRLIDNITLL